MDLECRIEGVDCANCAAKLEEKIAKIKGIEDVDFNFMTQKLEVELSEDADKDEVLKEIIRVAKDQEPDCTVEEL